MACKSRNMFYQSKKQETMEIVTQAEDGVQAPKHVPKEQDAGDDGKWCGCECANDGRQGKLCPSHWEEKRLELARRVRRQELIPRAKLRHPSPDTKSACLNERPLRATLSCCDRMTRPLHPQLRHTESTRLYPKHVNFDEQLRNTEGPITNGYDTYNSRKTVSTDYGYSTLPLAPPRPVPAGGKPGEEESDIEYYTSSETGSQETVKFNGGISKLAPSNMAPVPKQTTVPTNNGHILGGVQNKSGIQIVVQSPERIESEEGLAQAVNLRAEIDLKIQAKPIDQDEIPADNGKPDDEPPKPPQVPTRKQETIPDELKCTEPSDPIIKISEEVTILDVKPMATTPDIIQETKHQVQKKLESVEESKKEDKLEPVIPKNKVADIVNHAESHYNPKAPLEKYKTMDPKIEGKPPKAPPLPKMKLIKFNTINPRVEEVDENPDQTFYEEEYSYEPELKQSSSKVVLRTRSLLNLDEDINTTLNNVVKKSVGGNKHKITTGPDGTFRFGGRKATSEMNLSDESRPNSTKTSPKSVRHCSGEELRKRKEEIFRNKNSKSEININKYNEEINSNNSETTKARALSNLKKYLQGRNIGLREILVNNNVVIIEPVRSEGSQTDVSEYNHRNAAELDGHCRITGTKTKPGCPKEANKKSPEANTLPRVSKPFQTAIQRHFFYHQGIKTNRELKDEELPDPDKVRNARQMFQNVVKFARRDDHIIMLPISAKLYNSAPNIDQKMRDSKPRVTPEVRVIDCPKSSKEKLDKSTETDTKHDILKRILNKKWTDTGSLSSGVSSDMSCFDNELDCNDMASQKEMFSSEEDEGQEFYCRELDTHPVSPEVMNKIRACGTSVTYYGGRVISHTDGPARSPMTMTIMDEIRQTGNSEDSRRFVRNGDQYMGVKFRLVKSNSCGSRLELAGTAEEPIHEQTSHCRHHEDIYGPAKTLSEELAECRGRMEPIEDLEPQDEKPAREMFNKAQKMFQEKSKSNCNKQPVQSWRALIESRKQNRSMESHRPCPDMEFEEFEVLEG